MGKKGHCNVEVTSVDSIINRVNGLDIGELLLIDVSSDGRGEATTKNCMSNSTAV